MLRTTRHTPGDTHMGQRHTAQQGPRTTSAHAPTRVRLRNKADRRRYRGMPGMRGSYRKCRNRQNYGGNQWEVVVTCSVHHVLCSLSLCVYNTDQNQNRLRNERTKLSVLSPNRKVTPRRGFIDTMGHSQGAHERLLRKARGE